MADLCLLAENGAVAQRWEIGEHPVAFGRDESADVIIEDDTLSRRHFQIWREGGSFRIKDLNSQNGTWVGGQRVRETTLSQDVCVAAGRTLFMFSERLPSMSTVPTALAAACDPAAVLPPAFAASAARASLASPAD